MPVLKDIETWCAGWHIERCLSINYFTQNLPKKLQNGSKLLDPNTSIYEDLSLSRRINNHRVLDTSGDITESAKSPTFHFGFECFVLRTFRPSSCFPCSFHRHRHKVAFYFYKSLAFKQNRKISSFNIYSFFCFACLLFMEFCAPPGIYKSFGLAWFV